MKKKLFTRPISVVLSIGYVRSDQSYYRPGKHCSLGLYQGKSVAEMA